MEKTPTKYGLCYCGCGQETVISTYTRLRDKRIKGEPLRYIKGHGVKNSAHVSRKYQTSSNAMCVRCKRTLPLSDFRFSERKQAYESSCQKCDKARRVASNYGLTTVEYLNLVEGAPCHICGKLFDLDNCDRVTAPQIDHCHSTGKIRGVLCGQCNRLIAQAREDVTILQKAIDYLILHKSLTGEEDD